MKKYSTLAEIILNSYLVYIFFVSIIIGFFVGWQSAIVLGIIGLPFFILSIIILSCQDSKYTGYQWCLSPKQNSEEEKLVEYYHEYTQLFTHFQQPPTPLCNIAHLLTLIQPYQSSDEATWATYADCVVAQQKGN